MLSLRLLLTLAASATVHARVHTNTFNEDDAVDLRVYLGPSVRFSDFNNSDALIWSASSLRYSTSSPELTATVSVPITAALLANRSLFAHAFFTARGASPDPMAAAYDRWATTHTLQPLVVYGERLKPSGLRNLLTDEPAPWEAALQAGLDAAAAAGKAEQWIAYWKPGLHLQLVVDHEVRPLGTMPPLYHNFLRGHGLVEAGRGGRFRPLVYVNELTVMRMHWIAINTTRACALESERSGPDGRAAAAAVEEAARACELPLELSFKPLAVSRFQWMVNLKHSFAMQEESLGITEKESEDLRGMFVHTNPVLLYTTVAVSALHMLFDVLAFKNDLSFWSSVDTMEGLSTRSLLLNEVMELVILLYLLEQESSWLVQIGSVLTLALGLFKIVKSRTVKKADQAKAKDGESLTDRYDRIAFQYLSPPLALLVVGYSAHSLVYGYHKGWYSWLLESLVALVYGGGFIVMTPQLFINYRLKSVAHLPWKFFMYKALNTFIDDLFAFIIKMPTLHRMSCFRDDIVFAIFMYAGTQFGARLGAIRRVIL